MPLPAQQQRHPLTRQPRRATTEIVIAFFPHPRPHPLQHRRKHSLHYCIRQYSSIAFV